MSYFNRMVVRASNRKKVEVLGSSLPALRRPKVLSYLFVYLQTLMSTPQKVALFLYYDIQTNLFIYRMQPVKIDTVGAKEFVLRGGPPFS